MPATTLSWPREDGIDESLSRPDDTELNGDRLKEGVVTQENNEDLGDIRKARIKVEYALSYFYKVLSF